MLDSKINFSYFDSKTPPESGVFLLVLELTKDDFCYKFGLLKKKLPQMVRYQRC